jgi:hypothetical protein
MSGDEPTDHARRPRGEIAFRPVSDQIVDSVITELNELHGQATLEVALKMGAIIVNRFYGGDMRTWREHRRKEASFRKLAARSDLTVSATTLYRAVALYELTQRLRIGDRSSLTMTHLRVVISLPEADQEALLEQAETNQWSTERLERESTRIRSLSVRRPGRPAVPPLVIAVRKLVRTCDRVAGILDEEDPGRLPLGELKSVYEALDQVRVRVESFARRIAIATEPHRLPMRSSGGRSSAP